MPSVLIVGLDSIVAQYLNAKFKSNGWVVYGTTRKQSEVDNKKFFFLDLLNPNRFSLSDSVSIDVVIFCASVTSIKFCCENTSICTSVNYDSLLHIAQYLKKRFDPFMIFPSSNTVFDGKKPFRLESEKTCPVNLYGILKANAEKGLFDITDKLAVVRATKILFREHPLIMNWIDDLNHQKIINPFDDLTVSPVSMNKMITAIFKLAAIKKNGIFHFSGDKDITYYDLAKCIAKKLGASENLIQSRQGVGKLIPVEYAPKYTSLDMSNSTKILSLSYEKYTDILDVIFH